MCTQISQYLAEGAVFFEAATRSPSFTLPLTRSPFRFLCDAGLPFAAGASASDANDPYTADAAGTALPNQAMRLCSPAAAGCAASKWLVFERHERALLKLPDVMSYSTATASNLRDP